MSQFVSLNEVVANSALLIKDTDPRHRNILRQWTYLGERQLGFSGLHDKAEQVEVDNLTIKKPSDYAVGNDLALFDANDNEYKIHFHGSKKRIHNEVTILSGTVGGFSYDHSEIGVSEDPYYFYLDSNGESVTYANIRYYSYPIDEDGDMLIPEHHLFALINFNFWMWEKRRNENQSSISMAKNDWLMEQSKAKAKNKVPSMLEGKDIVRMHSSMIDKIFYNKF
jgi:hypothetical protein